MEKVEEIKAIAEKIQKAVRIFEKIQQRKKTVLMWPEPQPGVLTPILDREKNVIDICQMGIKSFDNFVFTLQSESYFQKKPGLNQFLIQFLDLTKSAMTVWEQEHLLLKVLNNTTDKRTFQELSKQISEKQKEEQSIVENLIDAATAFKKGLEELQRFESTIDMTVLLTCNLLLMELLALISKIAA